MGPLHIERFFKCPAGIVAFRPGCHTRERRRCLTIQTAESNLARSDSNIGIVVRVDDRDRLTLTVADDAPF